MISLNFIQENKFLMINVPGNGAKEARASFKLVMEVKSDLDSLNYINCAKAKAITSTV